MRYIFSAYENIKELYLSSFDKKIFKNMEKMLEEYISNIKSLDWSSFNSEKSPDKKFYL